VNRILAGGHGLRVAVVVNDFGAVNIDSRLIVDRDATTITLDNGCICCSMAGDLVEQLTRLLEGPSAPDHVVIETSGVSDPGRILLALRDRHLGSLARVDGVITLVDAERATAIPAGHLELARRQLAVADVIVFNKADLVSLETLDTVHAWMSHPTARVLDAVDADVPLELLLGVGREPGDASGDTRRPVGAASVQHDRQFSTWTWSSSRPVALGAVRSILGDLPSHVYRAKGFLHVIEQPDQRVVAHVVGRRVDLRPIGTWDEGQPRCELVFISLDPRRDGTALGQLLDAATR
jgi:G3E family GTPase